MIATLRFNLEDVDQRREHLLCVKSNDLAMALWDISSQLRTWDKHGCDDFTPEKVRQFFYDTMNEHNIDLDELVV